MTVSTSTSFVSYAGNGSLTTFAYTFKIFQDSDLLVTLVNDASGAETTQVLTTNYTVTGAGTASGGNVTFTTAPASGTTVKIRRVLPVTQETDYVANDPFPAEAHEDALDKLTMLVQQEAANSDLAISFPEGDIGSGLNNVVPSAVERADKLLSFDTEGNVQTQSAADLLTGSVLGANYTKASHTGDGTIVAFSTTEAAGSKNNIQVYIDGVYQNKDTFSISGSVLTFTEAPPLNSAIEFIVGNAVTSLTTDPAVVLYNQGGTGAQDRTLTSKLQEHVTVKDFGAVGDGVVDDTTAFQAAIDYCKTSGLILHVNAGTYKLTSTLDMNDGYENAVSLVGLGGFSNEPVLEFQDGVDIGLLVKNSKNTLIQDLSIDISNVTNDAVGILWYGVWHSKMSNVSVVGGGKTDPASNATHYGIAFRPTYNGTVTSKTSAVDLEAISGGNTGTNQGVYWNILERLDVRNCSYGLTLYGGEGGSNPRTNQNQYNSCKFNQNWYNVLFDGAGGGNTFISCTAEEAGDTGVLVESMSSGTTPVWIGGELSDANNNKWKGQGLLLGAVAGTGFPKANASGYQGTNFRFSDQGPQLEGKKLTGDEFLSDWTTKQDVPVSGSGTTTSKSFDMVTIAPDGTGTDAVAYEISVIMQDGTSPQGTSVMIYHALLNRAAGQSLSGGVVEISERTEWFNLGGGTVAPTVTMSIASDVATVTANLNWDSVGNNPEECTVNYKIRELNELSDAGWTLTAL